MLRYQHEPSDKNGLCVHNSRMRTRSVRLSSESQLAPVDHITATRRGLGTRAVMTLNRSWEPWQARCITATLVCPDCPSRATACSLLGWAREHIVRRR